PCTRARRPFRWTAAPWRRLTTSRSWRCPSRQTAKQQRGIAHRIDPQADAAPLDRVPLAGDQVLDGRDVAAVVRQADLNVAERKPELMRLARQRDRRDDAVGLVDRFLDEADHVAVFDRDETQIAGLLQGGVGAAGAVEIADVVLDVSFLVPVPRLDLVFFGVEIFFLARDRIMLQQFEAVIDAIAAR